MQAAQALEPAALVPFQLLAPGGQVVLVGDPKQLPPTVLSRAAEASNLAQSLFERLQQVGFRVLSLGFGIFWILQSSSLEGKSNMHEMFVGSVHCQHTHMHGLNFSLCLLETPEM